MNNNDQGSNGPWKVTKEKILLFTGIAMLLYLFIGVTSFHQAFHVEFLVIIAAMFGLSIAGWGDKK